MQYNKSKTFALQTDLGLYCRTGIDEPKTSIQENTFHYRRLVYNVIKDTLKNAFPITKKLIGKKRWKKAVAHFFENHKCKTPQVWKLPLEFYEYYSENALPFKKEFPFINELLHYEWLEIEIFMMEDLPVENFDTEKTSHNQIIVPNPEIKVLALQYPVHIKKVKLITEEDKAQYFVTIHRDFHTKKVRFNNLSYPFVEMLVKINEENTNIDDLKIIFSKYENDNIKIETAISNFISFAFRENMLLGYK